MGSAFVIRVIRVTLGRGTGYTIKKSSQHPNNIAHERRVKSIERAARSVEERFEHGLRVIAIGGLGRFRSAMENM